LRGRRRLGKAFQASERLQVRELLALLRVRYNFRVGGVDRPEQFMR
jgi:hypothetical protein